MLVHQRVVTGMVIHPKIQQIHDDPPMGITQLCGTNRHVGGFIENMGGSPWTFKGLPWMYDGQVTWDECGI